MEKFITNEKNNVLYRGKDLCYTLDNVFFIYKKYGGRGL